MFVTKFEVPVINHLHGAKPTSGDVLQADRAEGMMRQPEIVRTLQLLGIVFPEEEPHIIFGPFGRDQPMHLNLSIQ